MSHTYACTVCRTSRTYDAVNEAPGRSLTFDRRAKKAWIACTRQFAWFSPGAIAWRKRVSEVAAALGVSDLAGLKHQLGPKWAYRLREAITLASEEEWWELVEYFNQRSLKDLTR